MAGKIFLLLRDWKIDGVSGSHRRLVQMSGVAAKMTVTRRAARESEAFRGVQALDTLRTV